MLAFVDELEKIAEEVKYRPVCTQAGRLLLQSGIPVLRGLPEDPEEAKAKIRSALRRKNSKKILGHATVAIKPKHMGDPKTYGFKPTRLAVPLPGSLTRDSWRSGKLHMHKVGPIYLAHEDAYAAKGVRAVAHALVEGVPALFKRLVTERTPVVKKHK